MYLLFVDESGDTGLINSPTDYFILAGLVVHELKWRDTVEAIISFRRAMRTKFQLKLREEIHASELINSPGALARIPKHHRLEILRDFADALSAIPDVRLICVVIDKRNKPPAYDVFDSAWKALVQRFENTIAHKNFPGAYPSQKGMMLCDHTDDKKLTTLIRKMRAYNPIPNQIQHGPGYRDLGLTTVIEDPAFRDSARSMVIQAVDTCAYLLQQQCKPSKFMRKKGGHNYFKRLAPIACKVVSRSGDGIVHL